VIAGCNADIEPIRLLLNEVAPELQLRLALRTQDKYELEIVTE
jgi:hypothetical protein